MAVIRVVALEPGFISKSTSTTSPVPLATGHSASATNLSAVNDCPVALATKTLFDIWTQNLAVTTDPSAWYIGRSVLDAVTPYSCSETVGANSYGRTIYEGIHRSGPFTLGEIHAGR